MKPLFFTMLTLFSVAHHSSAQTETLQDVRNKLLCNVYDYQHADAATNRFLRANFPYLTKPAPPGGLFLPPIGANSKREIVSMKFQQHPFFHFNLKEGRVDFHAVIDPNTDKFETGADLWLIFENESDANAAFNVLTDSLSSVSNQKKTTSDNGQMTTLFSGSGKNGSAFTVKLILKKDESGNFAIYLPSNDRSLL